MGWLTDTLFNFRLKQVLSANSSRKSRDVKNNGMSVALLFDESQIDSQVDLQKQVTQWEKSGKTVETFRFIDVKEFSEEDELHNKFCKKDINWFQVPKGEKVSRFIGEQYDILITINPEKKKHLLYLNAASQAKFKIGLLPEDVEFYNLLIDCNKPNSIKAIFSDINITLDKLTA